MRFRPPRSLPSAASWITGSILYQQEKKEREAKKHQKPITVKEVKFRINVDDHDYETKKNHVLRFLDEGDKVKATIFFRGREMTRTEPGTPDSGAPDQGRGAMSIVEFRPRQEGNTLHAILAPKKRTRNASKERQKAAAQSAPRPEAPRGTGRQARVVRSARQQVCRQPVCLHSERSEESAVPAGRRSSDIEHEIN